MKLQYYRVCPTSQFVTQLGLSLSNQGSTTIKFQYITAQHIYSFNYNFKPLTSISTFIYLIDTFPGRLQLIQVQHYK